VSQNNRAGWFLATDATSEREAGMAAALPTICRHGRMIRSGGGAGLSTDVLQRPHPDAWGSSSSQGGTPASGLDVSRAYHVDAENIGLQLQQQASPRHATIHAYRPELQTTRVLGHGL